MAANVQHYICWKFAGRLLDRVNTSLILRVLALSLTMARSLHGRCRRAIRATAITHWRLPSLML